jgi:hypothetical protein
MDADQLKDLTRRLESFANDREGDLAIGFANSQWSVALTWGREAPDSPMAGAQALGSGSLLEDALLQVADQAGIEVPNRKMDSIALVGEMMCEECDAFLGKAHRDTCSKAGRVVEMADATEKFTTLEQSQAENPLLGLDRATVEIILRALPPQSEITEDDREKMGELRVGLAKFVTGCEEAEA